MNRPERTISTEEIRVERRLPSYWRVTFDMPPLNIFGPKHLPQLNDVVTAIETDPNVKVVVFDSAVDGVFITHYDFVAPLEESLRVPPGPTGLQALPDALVRLSRARSFPSHRSVAGQRGSGARSRLRATCGLPVARGRSCRNGRWAPASYRAEDRWHDCRA